MSNCRVKMSSLPLKFVDLYRDLFVSTESGVDSFPFRNWHVWGPMELVFWCGTHPEDSSSREINTLELSPQSPRTQYLLSCPLHSLASLFHGFNLFTSELTPALPSRNLGMGAGQSFLLVWCLPFSYGPEDWGLQGFSPGEKSKRSGI